MAERWFGSEWSRRKVMSVVEGMSIGFRRDIRKEAKG